LTEVLDLRVQGVLRFTQNLQSTHRQQSRRALPLEEEQKLLVDWAMLAASVLKDGAAVFALHRFDFVDLRRLAYLTSAVDELVTAPADAGGQPGAGGAVVAFEVDPTTTALKQLNTVPSMGAFPAFISIAPDGSCVAVANHGSYEATTRVVQEAGRPEVQRLYDDASVALFPAGKDQLSPASEVAVFAQ
jgi:hypothetical protein